jgi:hypothetical protein
VSRQHSIPLYLPTGMGRAVPLVPLNLQNGTGAVSELDIQMLVQTHPECLPIAEIDPMFINPVPICIELNTILAGSIDNFMVTSSGLPVLVECKLWRNPQARRELVGQILDYAKEITRWSSSDLQREVSRRLNLGGNPLLQMVQAADPSVDEAQFNDALTHNLRRGRFLLLIVGDGIREGVEAITEYLNAHAGMHFSLGLVEMPIYLMPDGGRVVAPRVLLKTATITRTVVALPSGMTIEELEDGAEDVESDPDRRSLQDEQEAFWKTFLTYVDLDDQAQPVPKAPRQGFISFMLPAPGGSSWLTVYRERDKKNVGLFLSSHRNTPGEDAMDAIAADWPVVKLQLGGAAGLTTKDGRPRIFEARHLNSMTDPAELKAAFEWLAERVNTYINVLRPRVASVVADLQAAGTTAVA